MSKDAFYFSHDSNARNDQRLMKIRMKYGMEGYGIYFGIIEILREQSDYYLYKNEITTLAYYLRADEKMVNDIILNYNLFEIDGNEYPPETFHSRSLTRRMEKLDEKRKIRSDAGRKGGKATALLHQKDSIATALNKSKLKENKEIKVNNINKRKIEFEDDVKNYQSLFGEDFIDDFINYWTEPNKSNTKMKFEMQPTWDTKRRIQRWVGNDFNTNKTNGLSKFKKDANGKFWIGYCNKCNKSDFYDDIGIKQDSRCCQSKLMPKKIKNA